MDYNAKKSLLHRFFLVVTSKGGEHTSGSYIKCVCECTMYSDLEKGRAAKPEH
jgi:hypothetical protein